MIKYIRHNTKNYFYFASVDKLSLNINIFLRGKEKEICVKTNCSLNEDKRFYFYKMNKEF